jgi:hypothetical protein
MIVIVIFSRILAGFVTRDIAHRAARGSARSHGTSGHRCAEGAQAEQACGCDT